MVGGLFDVGLLAGLGAFRGFLVGGGSLVGS